MSNQPVLAMSNIRVSLPLFSKPPLHFATNAVIVAIDTNKALITIVTDFGNELVFSIDSLAYRYTTSQEYLDGFTTEDVETRLTTQIRNLKEQLEKYRHVKGF
jgi:hypothetical protein